MFLSVVPQEYTASGEKGHNVRGSKAEKEVMMADGVSNTVSPKWDSPNTENIFNFSIKGTCPKTMFVIQYN